MDWLVGFIGALQLVWSPYTKVEESFNLQACHDILYHGTSFYKYDHLEFSGAVPRTFIGPLFVSSVAYPFVYIVKIFGLQKLYAQYLVRFALGFLIFIAWQKLKYEVYKIFGPDTALWFTLICASQFHFIYYMTRTLPNVFALFFVLYALSYWLDKKQSRFIICSGIAVLIFRSEVCLLLGPIILHDLATKNMKITTFLWAGGTGGLLCLLSTILVDSFFWGRLLWPEGEVFWFNTYQNQSHNWGIYPFLWYWYSALPRALGFSCLLVPVGIVIDPRIKKFMTPALLFVFLYSFLPHKELRFIIYVLPILNVAAARVCNFFYISREKSIGRYLICMCTCFHLLGNAMLTLFLLSVSSQNYPGGAAIHRLHSIIPLDANVHVHIDNLAAQSGVTRFLQTNDHWRYNKTENLKAGSRELRSFTHLILEAKTKFAFNMKKYTKTHTVLDQIEAFSHVNFNYQSFPPVKVRVKPALFILENTVYEDIDWSFVRQDILLASQEEISKANLTIGIPKGEGFEQDFEDSDITLVKKEGNVMTSTEEDVIKNEINLKDNVRDEVNDAKNEIDDMDDYLDDVQDGLDEIKDDLNDVNTYLDKIENEDANGDQNITLDEL